MLKTVKMQTWEHSYLEANAYHDSFILNPWGISGPLQCFGRSLRISMEKTSPEFWSPPPPSFFKLNFDEASKGNPRPTGFRCITRNHQGELQGFKTSFIVRNSNNVVKVEYFLPWNTYGKSTQLDPVNS